MKIRLLAHAATFATAVAFGLLMLASPAKATPAGASAPACSFCSHSMGQAFSVAPMNGPFSKMIDSRFRFDGDNGSPNFFIGGDIVSNSIAETDDASTPEPGTLLLLATGLAGLAFLVRKTA